MRIIKNLKPATAHLRKELSKLPREALLGNQLSCFLKCAVFVRISPRETKFQISNMADIFLGRPRLKTHETSTTRDETAELIASQGSLFNSFLKYVAGFTMQQFFVLLVTFYPETN